MIAKLLSKFYVTVLCLTLLSLCISAQTAQIIENFIPNSGDVSVYMMKQGSDNNLYMTLTYPQSTELLPYPSIGICIANTQGQVMHYSHPDWNEYTEVINGDFPVFCLESNNAFRLPYISQVLDSITYVDRFNWCMYSPANGFSYQHGFQSQSHLFDYLTDCIRINADKWIVTGKKGSDVIALCVNANGDSLWSYQTYGYSNKHNWVKRISDDRILLAHYYIDLMMKVLVLDQNGQVVWQQIYGNPAYGPHVTNVFLGDYYSEDRAIVAYDICSGQEYIMEYYNNTLTELFNVTDFSLWFTPSGYCSINSFLFSQVDNTFRKYDSQGLLEWEYALPDSFYAPRCKLRIINVPADSCYVTVGHQYIGFDQMYMIEMYRPYFLKLPYNLTANEDEVLPAAVCSLGVYPNPFREDLQINIKTDRPEAVEIKIYNVKGQLIRQMERFSSKAGINQLSWDGKSGAGKLTARGLYIIKAKIGSQVISKKCLRN